MYFLLSILAGTIAGTFILIWYGKYSEVFIQTVLPSLTTLIGSALGFTSAAGKEKKQKKHSQAPLVPQPLPCKIPPLAAR